MFRRLFQRFKRLWQLAKSERASPREIGWAVALGAFAGCTPAIGFHGWLAIGMATLFRKNRLFAWLGARISNMLMLPFIALAEVQVAHRARTGAWLDIDRDQILEQAPSLLLDWFLGCIPVGLVIGAVLGLVVYAIANWRAARAARKQRLVDATPTPAEAPPPSSGSPA